MNKSGSLNTTIKKWNWLRITGLALSSLQLLLFIILVAILMVSAANGSTDGAVGVLVLFLMIIFSGIINSIFIFVSKNNSKVLCGILSIFLGWIISLFFWLFAKPEIDINTVRQMVHNEINQSQSMNHKDLNNQDNNEWL